MLGLWAITSIHATQDHPQMHVLACGKPKTLRSELKKSGLDPHTFATSWQTCSVQTLLLRRPCLAMDIDSMYSTNFYQFLQYCLHNRLNRWIRIRKLCHHGIEQIHDFMIMTRWYARYAQRILRSITGNTIVQFTALRTAHLCRGSGSTCYEQSISSLCSRSNFLPYDTRFRGKDHEENFCCFCILFKPFVLCIGGSSCCSETLSMCKQASRY